MTFRAFGLLACLWGIGALAQGAEPAPAPTIPAAPAPAPPLPVAVPKATGDWISTVRRVTKFTNILLYGFLAGNFASVSIGQVPFQNTLDAHDYVLVKHGTELSFGPVIPPFMVVADILPLAQLVLIDSWKNTSFVLTVSAHILMVAATIVTLVVNLPINAQAAQWDANNPPANWMQARDQWNAGQTARTILTLPAFAAMAAAALFE